MHPTDIPGSGIDSTVEPKINDIVLVKPVAN